MANYTINKEKKIITVNYDKLTEKEKSIIALNVMGGYTVKPLSEKRSKNAKKRAKAMPTKAEILTKLKTEEDRNLFLEKCKENFFQARAWYLKEYNK